MSAWPGEVPGTRTDILTEVVPVGARSFQVVDASAFQVGDNVIVVHPSTQTWIDAINGGGTDSDDDWIPGDLDIVYNRRITAIHENGIIIDSPVFNHLTPITPRCLIDVELVKTDIDEWALPFAVANETVTLFVLHEAVLAADECMMDFIETGTEPRADFPEVRSARGLKIAQQRVAGILQPDAGISKYGTVVVRQPFS